jgi:anhydro-N-acetylmuramic acid kinase
MTERPALGIGLMSGTSLDGVDAALVRFSGPTHADLLGFVTRPYSAGERAQIHQALDGGAGAAALARLHVSVSEWAADAVEQLLGVAHTPASSLDFIAMHGQTVWHEPPLVSWQIGEPAVLAERFGRPVVSNFRSRDVAAGGQGAPLVPAADVLLFGAADAARVLLNVGGMANATYVSRRAIDDGAIAFDTGPGVVLIDALARLVDPALPYDRDGHLARSGVVNPAELARLLADPWFDQPPPRSTGRERFGDAMAREIHARVPGADGVATAVALTVETIGEAIRRFMPEAPEVVISGGGARHPVLFESLATMLATQHRRLRRFDELFFDGDAKEAVAFALLGYLTLHGQPANLPSCTGARGARVLGSITPG